MDYHTLKISTQQAENFLFKLYGIKGVASELPGYLDFNFKISLDNKELYILKISRPKENIKKLEYQQDLLQFIEHHNDQNLTTPRALKDKNHNFISEVEDDFGNTRFVRLITWISGRVWSSVNPQLEDFRFSIGQQCGLLTKTLQGFYHPEGHYKFEWDIAQSLWTKKYLHLFQSNEKEILNRYQNKFEASYATYSKLRKSIIHNDFNNNNIIVTENLLHPKAKAVIDFGDAIYTQIVNDVAILCAYGMMKQQDPLNASLALIKGYHLSFPLLQEELACLYNAIAMRLVITITKAAISKVKEPENNYLWISEKPAWETLKKWNQISEDFAHFTFRNACGFEAHPDEQSFYKWAKKEKFKLSDLFPTIGKNEIHHLDLSVSSTFIGHQKEYNNLDAFQFKIDQLQKEVPNKILAGGYLEPRSLYTSKEYDTVGNFGKESRTIHLGTDFWLPAYTPVHALIDGEVVIATNDAGDKEYGGLVVLKHTVENLCFYTLYGHNTPKSVCQYSLGDVIKKGEQIAVLAKYPENGNWPSHLHFQVILSLLDYQLDFPGVTYFNQIEVWKSICPNPNVLFKLEASKQKLADFSDEIKEYRQSHLGKGMSLQYKKPLHIVRGFNQYLIDHFGKKYLDTVNNVAHVGHENFDVVKAGQKQMAVLNTNTRYLHKNILSLAKELLSTFPKKLSVVHFVNSGSEANELAVRMVKSFTNSKEMIVSEMGYHGNTNTSVDISSYKFEGKGGYGTPAHTHVFPMPDTFRGKYKGKNSGTKYVEEIQNIIKDIHLENKKVGGFIIEPIISCGGQIELPNGFLKQAYQCIRKAGGLCISDEVQTGCGRLGKAFWGFDLHNVLPDIVTIGKPLGNGHPVAAVVCTEEVADAFANGMEYFNTFGGNPVSCAIAYEVLRTVKREKLQENALEVGTFLKDKLKKLAQEISMIGDVRGQGLFLGIELVDKDLLPLTEKTSYLINRMKDFGILMSIDGPNHNVIKIKPPLTFTLENAKEVLFYLEKVFDEDFMKNKS